VNIESKITVGNNVELGFDSIRVTTSCVGFVHVFIPQKEGNSISIELKRTELIEFLLRTQPNLEMALRVGVHGGDKAL
jgi:hypothetical protein